jgi:hypothetical protein
MPTEPEYNPKRKPQVILPLILESGHQVVGLNGAYRHYRSGDIHAAAGGSGECGIGHGQTERRRLSGRFQ